MFEQTVSFRLARRVLRFRCARNAGDVEVLQYVSKTLCRYARAHNDDGSKLLTHARFAFLELPAYA